MTIKQLQQLRTLMVMFKIDYSDKLQIADSPNSPIDEFLELISKVK